MDDNENDCTFEFEDYIKRMPDGRSITLFKLNDNINVKSLKDMLFREQYERFQEVQPFLEILEKQEKNWSPLKIGLITVGGIGAIGTVAAISSLIKKNLSTKPKITKPEVKNQEIKNPGNNKLLT